MAYRVCYAIHASTDTKLLLVAADTRTALGRFPGGLKQRTAQEQFAKDPSSILREAVLGMLPKNNLRKVSASTSLSFYCSQQRTGCCSNVAMFTTQVGFSRWVRAGLCPPQGRDRKLRIFPSADHPFQDHPRLIGWEPSPRRLRIKEPLFELPEGWEPMNPEARLRGHMAV